MKASTALVFGTIAGVSLSLTVAACSIPVPAPAPAPTTSTSPRLEEDDPNWDCRFDGNERCGVEIQGVTYVIQFRDGSPESVGYPSNY